MPEKSLNLPLSGEEIIEAVCEKLRQAMKRDCFLSPNAAYESFHAEVTVKVTMSDIGRMPEAKFQVIAEEGEKTAAGKPQMSKTEFEIEAAPPNQVRLDTGQPVPVLTTGQPSGRPEIKPVSYKKPGAFTR